MNLFKIKLNSFALKVILISLFFLLPTIKVHAAEWSGEIYVNEITAEATTEAPDFTIAGSDASSTSYLFYTKFTVKHPAVDTNGDGTISSSELGSWAAVEASKVEKIGGSFYLAPDDVATATCPGGLCIQVSTDKNFSQNITILPKMGYNKPFMEPEVTKKTVTPGMVIKGFKNGTKYYYRFIGEETGPNEHYFPFNPFDKSIIGQNADYYDNDPGVPDHVADIYSFTTGGESLGAFSIEIPPATLTYNSVEIRVHTPEAQMVLLSLFKGSEEIYNNTILADQSIPDPAGGGYFQRFTIGVTTTLEPSTEYKAVAKIVKSGVIVPTGPSDYQTTEKLFTTAGDPHDISTAGATSDTNYNLLAPLPNGSGGPFNSFDSAQDCAFGVYFNIVMKIFIGLCAVLAMIMIVIGGVEYMTSELASGKEGGKKRITDALFGLLLALGAFALLNTLNPKLLDACLGNVTTATLNVISPEDTSTGSDTSLCLPSTPPNPDSATGTTITLNNTMTTEYISARDSISNLSTGIKLIITAQTYIEGFKNASEKPPSGTKSYQTKNHGNRGNTDNGNTKTYSSLTEGITAQRDIITRVANGNSKSYKIGSKIPCALGNEAYDGSLYQYLRIYSTGARTTNNYLNAIIGFFKQSPNNKTITARTKMSEIYNMQ